MDQETIIRKRRKGDHAVPDIKEKQPRLLTASLVEPLQSGSLAHVQYTGIHVTLYTVFLRWVLEVRYSCYYVLLPGGMSLCSHWCTSCTRSGSLVNQAH